MSTSTTKNRTPECPSDLRLDQLELGELAEASANTVRRHLTACAHCQEHVAELATARSAFLNLDSNDAVARIHQTTAGKTPADVERVLTGRTAKSAAAGGFRAWLASWQPAAMLAGALAITLAVRMSDPGAPSGDGTPLPPRPEVIRVKGGLGLTLHRERNGQVESLVSGDSAVGGDRIQFEVDLPADGFALILGVESTGNTYVAFPTNGASDAVPVLGGDDQLLPGAAALDASVGEEWLGLVWCDHPFGARETTWSTAESRVQAPEGCRTSSFRLLKSPK